MSEKRVQTGEAFNPLELDPMRCRPCRIVTKVEMRPPLVVDQSAIFRTVRLVTCRGSRHDDACG